MRLIDADVLMNKVGYKKSGVSDKRFTEGFNDATGRFRSMIHSAPTIEAEPVRHGRWEVDTFTAQYGNPYRCSICKEECDNTHNYCPNCGAKMDAKEVSHE